MLVVVEVSDSTLTFDRTRKLPLYARSGVAEAWLLDLRAGALEVHRAPHELGYTVSEVLHRGRQACTTSAPTLCIDWWEALGDDAP